MKKIFLSPLFVVVSLVFIVFVFINISLAQTSLTNTVLSPTTIINSAIITPISTSTSTVDTSTTNTTKSVPVTQNTTVVSPSASSPTQTTGTTNDGVLIQTPPKTQTSEPVKNTVPTTENGGVINSQVSPAIDANETVEVKNIPTSTQITETKIQSTSNTFEAMQNTIQNTKVELKKIIDQNINAITSKKPTTSTANIESIRAEMISNIDNTLTNTKSITPEKIEELSKNINSELDKINDTTQSSTTEPSGYSQTIEQTFKTMSLTIEEQVEVLKTQGGDLLYKDTNNDGISDYDSVHVYSIDPIKSSPTTVYEGREITAGDKVLLGLDPKESAIVKINPEEPIVSQIKPTEGYKVEEVKLTPDKKVTISGRFLPNSFVTIYIYSTPIIVTVKTDVNGEWQYTLDKELDNGKHTIYTATVNNTGKILAKSSAFPFIKTAEAATLENLPPVQVSAENMRPTILSGNNIYFFIGFFVFVILFTLIVIGIGSQKNVQPLQ
ncbi:MAG: Ig-like domain-containing protein [bacterium]